MDGCGRWINDCVIERDQDLHPIMEEEDKNLSKGNFYFISFCCKMFQ